MSDLTRQLWLNRAVHDLRHLALVERHDRDYRNRCHDHQNSQDKKSVRHLRIAPIASEAEARRLIFGVSLHTNRVRSSVGEPSASTRQLRSAKRRSRRLTEPLWIHE